MKRFLLFALILLANGYVMSQTTVKLTVQNAQTNEPVSHAFVELAGKRVYTNGNGKAAFVVREQGMKRLYVHLIGFQDYDQQVEISGLEKELTIDLEPFIEELVTIELSGIKASEKTPIPYTDLDAEQIEKTNTGRDVAFTLEQTPSVVATSDAGAGVGYTGIRVRGSDATRINVTVNGIPMNDAESHGVWWVNTPDLMSSTTNMQLQRGVGTSTNGAGAFGASLNMQTDGFHEKAHGEVHVGAGSFNTQRYTVNFGSGLINNHFWMGGRLSKILSDGYVDRASSDLKSYYLNGGFKNEKTMVRAVVFGGNEETYQAWNGIDSATFETNPTFNSAGALYDDNWNVTGYYDNEVDNYSQDHYQLHWNQIINENWDFNISLHYTYGRGYYEQYKQGEYMPEYGLTPIVIGQDTIDQTDLIRRKWLDNDFYGTVFSVNYTNEKLNLIIGGGYNQYDGRHFGEVIWARFASDSEIRQRYYESKTDKSDFNVYAKAVYDINNDWSVFGDLQVRTVSFKSAGSDDGFPYSFDDQNVFVNPKAGVNWQIADSRRMYLSYAATSREPNRTDLLYADPNNPVEPERLQDIELGYQALMGKTAMTINGYYMFYTNQLVLTGEIDNVGAPIRKNVGKSYRAGLEFVFDIELASWARWSPNLTVSMNKNQDYKEQTGDDVKNYGSTNIAYSPNVIGASNLEFYPVQGLTVGLFSKYVGEQYLSNIDNDRHKLDAYFINDIRLAYDIPVNGVKKLNIYLNIYNVFDVKYASNGYVWGTTPYYYAQAGRNLMGGVILKF
ncbi:MAG: TonB-dependent receptor [Schleiferiaceae bacterium]|nr:TonB-dependent receptor [Schleiferiaceae bacterium]